MIIYLSTRLTFELLLFIWEIFQYLWLNCVSFSRKVVKEGMV